MTKIPLCYTCGIEAAGIKLNGVPICRTCMDNHFPQKEEKKKVEEKKAELKEEEFLDLDLDFSEWMEKQETPSFLKPKP